MMYFFTKKIYTTAIFIVVLLCNISAQEYRNLKDYTLKTGKKQLSEGAWLRRDRMKNSLVWQAANAHNLQKQNGFINYMTITQRTHFYKWFADVSAKRGHTVRWAGIASVVSGQFSLLDHCYTKPFFPKSIIQFANEGNKAIFDDVFPTFLRDLYNEKDSIVGIAALKRDTFYLQREQADIIQPLYAKQSEKTLNLLAKMAKGQGVFSLVLPKKLRLDGDLLSVNDRFDFGMNKLRKYYLSHRKP